MRIAAITSPIAIIVICSVSTVLLNVIMGRWVFIPAFMLYWGLSFIVTFKMAGSDIKKWLQKPAGKLGWLVLSVIAGLIPLQILLTHLHVITLPLLLLTIPFVVLNPFFEELFWRGIVIDYAFPSKTLSSLYSSVLFIASHLLIWGVFSYGNRNYYLVGSLAVMSAVWCIVRIKTKSLWWCIMSHFLVDICNLMVLVMLNVVIPEHGYIPALEWLFGAIQ